MAEWLPIETAPKDGTIIEVRNSCMDEPCRASWGEYRPPYNTNLTKIDWRTEFTPHKFFPTPAGRLVCPEEWRPVETEPPK